MSGQSNINKFTFNYTSQNNNLFNHLNYQYGHERIEIKIPLRDFQASNPLIYNDFLHTLKERNYPYITIKFSDNYMQTEPSGLSYHDVLITLAGITKQYRVKFNQQICGDHYFIKGSRSLKFSDFELTPPERFNGLIKVKDEIQVSFGFILKFTSHNSLSVTK